VGTVIEQRPEAGAILTDVENMVVNIVISKGPEVFPVPDLTGRTVADAQQLVSEYNFKVVQAEARFDDTAEVDTIIEQDPTAETELPGGSTITVTVSKGVESVTVPDVVGQTKKKATALLKDAGFAVNPSEQYSTSVKAGNVIEQNPRVGASLKKGDSVDIVISLGPEIREVTVPTVTTLPETAAKTTLENSGLKVTIVYEPTNLTGSVISQNPAGGKKVKEGTTVTIVVDDEAPQ
jgi:serine/threonine-protein kinase